MTVFELMSRLGAAGIKLWLEDDQLKFKAPKGAMTPELKDALVAQKQAVIDFLRQTRTVTDTDADRIPAVDRSGGVPLSFAQRGVWFVEQLAPGNSTFHIPSALYLRGILDRDALRLAFEQIIARHEALRTVFDASGDEVMQRVLPAETFYIPVEDVTALAPDEQRERSRRLAEACIRAPFDLHKGPVIRAQLIKLDDHLHGLVVVMHHLVSDGWSMDVFTREMAVLYAANRQGNPSPLPPLTVQYGDFASWQAAWLRDEALERQLAFWRDTLAGCVDPLALPFDRPRPVVQSSRGAALPFSLPGAAIDDMRLVARQLDTTPYVVLLSAYVLLLSRWSGQNDLNVGMPVAGRTRSELEAMIGFFVNLLVVRARPGECASLRDLVLHVRDQVLAAQSHQDVPFDAIVDALSVPRHLSHGPLCQVQFSFVTSRESGQGVVGGLEIEPMPVELVAARADITLMLVDTGREVRGIIEYNSDLFDSTTIEHFAAQFSTVVGQLSQSLAVAPALVAVTDTVTLGNELAVSSAQAIWPLTPMQRDIVLDAMHAGEPGRHAVVALLPLPGGISLAQMQRRLEQLLCRQPHLNTRVMQGQRPWHDVAYLLTSDQPVTLRECSVTPGQDLAQTLASFITGIDAALLAGGIVQQAEQQWLWVAMHQVLGDAVTATRVLDALLTDADAPGDDTVLRRWIDTQRASTDEPQARVRWRDRLAVVEPVAARRVNALRRTECVSICAQDWAGVKTWCNRTGMTPVALLRSVFALGVQALTPVQAGVCVVDLSCGKQAPAFVNATAVVPWWCTRLRECAGDRVQSALQCETGDALSLSTLGQWLGRDAVQVQFTHLALPDNAGLELHVPDVAGTLRLLVIERPDSVELGLFSGEGEWPETGLLTRMRSVIDQCVRCETPLVGALDWLTPAERTQQLTQWQGASRSLGHATLTDWWSASADRHAGRVAVVRGDIRLTYRELDRLSNQVAHGLIAAGLQMGDRVALCFGKAVMLPVAMLGAVKAGMVYVPMEAGYPRERLRYLIDDSGARCLIAGTDTIASLDGILPDGVVTLALDGPEQLSSLSDASLNLAHAADDALYLVYTSGSTGQPKGAGVRHSGEVNLLEWYIGDLGLGPDDRTLLVSAFGFDLTQKNLFAPLMSGGTLVIPESDAYDPDHLAAVIVREGVTLFNGAPSAFYPLVEGRHRAGFPFASLRHVVLGGEPIRTAIVRDWLQQTGASLINSYGPTECTDVVSAWRYDPGSIDDLALPIGRALANTRLYVTDSLGRLMPPGTTGELRIAGIGVGTGYHGREALTAEVFSACPYAEGQWYSTGDLVRYRDDGALVYVGRRDFQVKLRGLRIEPGEIDARLKMQNNVGDSLTLVIDDQLVSYVTGPGSLDRNALRESLRGDLPDFMVPAVVMVLPRWPLTPNGKIDRKALPTPAGAASDDTMVAPRNDSEQALADIWCEVLRRERVSVTASFFDVGGHSLLATQVISRVRHRFKVDVTVRAMFEAPTIEGMVRLIATHVAAGHVDEAPPLEPLVTPNRDTLSFAQYRLWFLDQLNQGSSEYNLPSALRIEGKLDIAVLERVFTTIVGRHESLRTRFLVADGMPVLAVDEAPARWVMPVTDLGMLDHATRQERLKQRVDQDAARPFRLAHDPLLRTELLRLGEEEHVMLVNIHHIIADGWSIGVLVNEVRTLYAAYSAGVENPLPPLPVQYSDFAVWQRQWLSGAVLDGLKAYWLEQLRGAPDVLRLPTDRPRPKRQTFNGAHLPVDLGDDLSARVQAFCDAHGLTPFMLLMGAYQILLGRHAQQQDVCVGIPIAGRNRAETEGLIGFFINGLIIRTRMTDNPSVMTYLDQVREVALGAYAHQDMPIDVLADALQFERSSEQAPGAQVGFALQNVPDESFDAERAGLRISSVEREQKTAKYELTLLLEQRGSRFVGVAEYNTDLFDGATIERMMVHFGRLVEQMIATPQVGIETLSLVTADELPSLLGVDGSEYEIRPLSPMQRDMYVDTLLDTSTLKNSLGYRILATGAFDIDTWIRAGHLIAEQQSLLRSSFVPAQLPWLDVAYLKVARTPRVHVTVVDWTDRVTTDEDIRQLGERLAWQPYDLHSDKLTEHFIYKLDGNRHFALFRGNHLLLDGAGIMLNLDHQIKVAEALTRGEEIPVIADVFHESATEARRDTDSHDTLRYWRSVAAGCEALDFAMPPQSRDAVAGRAGRRVERRLRLSDEHWAAVQAQSRAWGVHPAFYFKALQAVLLSVYCRAEDDFQVSEILGGRSGKHRRAYGNYFQVQPVVYPRTLFGADQTIDAVVSHVRQYRHRVKETGPFSQWAQRQVMPQGRLQFMFNYYNFIASNVLWGTPVTTMAFPQIQDGPVQFVVNDQDGWVDLVLIYLDDQFDDLRFLERMVQMSQQVLDGERLIGNFDLVLPDERAVVARHSYGEAITLPSGQTVVDHFGEQVRLTPDAIAVVSGESALSYRALDEASNRLARALMMRGVGQGMRVGLCLDRGVDLVMAIMAVLKSGAAYVPMDAQYPAERLSFILEDCGAPVLITQRCIRERLEQEGIHTGQSQVLSIDEDVSWRDQSASMPETRPSPADLIYVIYTSGSTGRPKGAAVYHRGETNLLEWYRSTLVPAPGDAFLLVSAIGFDLTQKNVFAALVSGATLVIPPMDHFDPAVVADAIERHRITFINGAPSAFYPVVEMTSHPGYPFASLRAVILGGEPIRLAALDAWRNDARVGARIINSYGPTECSDVVASYVLLPHAAAPHGIIPLGSPVCNTRLSVMSAQGRELPPGLCGELWISGAGVGAGYLGRDDLTREAFVQGPDGAPGWYRTGDVVRAWPDGALEYIGRRDFQIKLRGLRIELGEIEAALREIPGIADSVLQVVDERLVAWLVAPAGIDENDVRARLRTRVPDYMVPAAFVALKAWPLTPNGKIDRKALPSPDVAVRVEFIAPRNDTEERIAAIWRDVLGIERVGIHDDFFALGGHSLLAARAVAKFRAAFEVEIPLRALFEMHTIADIASYLDTLLWASRSASQTSQEDTGENRDEGWL